MSSRVEELTSHNKKPRLRRWWLWCVTALLGGLSLWWVGASDASGPCRAEATKNNPLLGLRWNKQRLEGKILKRREAGSYTYLWFQPDGLAPRWLVVWGQGQPSQTRVRLTVYGARSPFFSRRLKRCFSTLHFGRITNVIKP